MDQELFKYRISPRVVLANTKQKITVAGVDNLSRFHDDCEYRVTIVGMDGYTNQNIQVNGQTRECEATVVLSPERGILTIEHYFPGEQMRHITIERVDLDRHNQHIPPRHRQFDKRAISFVIYTLEEDLYYKRPFKGDMHIHTCGSDGFESGPFVAAQYRKFGYDFISITDHLNWDSSVQTIAALKDLKTAFKIFPGEEVHHPEGKELFHVVNFNGQHGITKIIENDPEGTEAKIQKIAKNIDGSEEDRQLLAWYKWIFDEIHKAGGIAIYPHPLWLYPGLNRYHIKPSISQAVYENGYCDVFEMFGGADPVNRKLHEMLYFDLCAKGIKYPFVASSDAHCSLEHNRIFFDQAWTIVFADKVENIPEHILKGYTAAIDNWKPEEKTVYASLRLAKYAYFLLDEYYEMHDALCNAAGQAFLRYVSGDPSQNMLVEALENELKKFNTAFFGV